MTQENSDLTLSNRPLRAALRVAWLAMTLLLLLLFIGGIPYRFAQLSEACTRQPCVLNALTTEEAAVLVDLGVSLSAYATWHITLESILGGVMTLLALFLFWRAFDSAQGILVAFMLTLISLNFMAETDTAFVAYNPSLRFLYDLLTSMTGVTFILFLYIFPDGRFVPRFARLPFALLLIVALLEPFMGIGGETPSAQFSYLYLYGFLISLVLGFFFQVYRYARVSTPVQRQQTKWVVVGVAAILSPILLYSMAVEIFPLQVGPMRLLFNTVGYGLMATLILLFPISMVFSILRYRLWDVDVIIRRTIVYGVLTATLAAVYFAAVVLLQSIFHGLTGQDSALAIVLSTLAIAALFSPLRRRIQTIFDRRFYRQNYDAALSLARFARTARDEVDLDTLTGELAGVVTDTMQPKHVSFWLRRQN